MAYVVTVFFDEEHYKPFGFTIQEPVAGQPLPGAIMHVLPPGEEPAFEAWWAQRGFTFDGAVVENVMMTLQDAFATELRVTWGQPESRQIG